MARIAYDCSGVIPACLLPLNNDLSIDEASYRKRYTDQIQNWHDFHPVAHDTRLWPSRS